MGGSGAQGIIGAIYWFIMLVLCIIFLFPIAALIYLISSILAACISGCSQIESLSLKWMKAPGACAKNMCNCSSISCNCL
mmetsp:Transcript_53963/g.66144  ORF Transcript_53963/g.66144 Transcript_53963/m.66144 type:complete len:80 (+) Transcript_53963:357-596(+)